MMSSRDDDGDAPLLESKPNAEEANAGMAPRRCTDTICLIVFLAFCGGLIYINQYALEVGDIRRLSHGFNYKGRLCGVDPGYEDRPLLYFCPSGLPIPGTDPPVPSSLDLLHPICVSECPVSSAQSFLCYGGAQVVTSEPDNAEGDYKQTITYDFVRTDAYPSYTFMHRYCIPKADALAKQVIDSIGDGAVAQLMMKVGTVRAGYPALAASAALSFFLGYAYLFALNKLARPLVYLCLFIMIVGSAGTGVYLLDLANEGGVGEGVGDGQTCEIVGYCLIVVSFIFLGLACLKKKAIEIGIACVEGACEAIFAMPSMLLQPIFELATKLVVLGAMLYGFLWVISTGDVKSSSATIGGVKVKGLSRTFNWKEEELYMIAYWGFGILWISEIFTALGQFVVSYSVTLWYFTEKDSSTGKKAGVRFPLLKGFFVGVFYHLGTIAIGAFLIAVLKMVRIILGTLAKQKGSDNAVIKLVIKILMCFITCFEKFVQFINKTAYMDVCINSSNFCTAAWNAMKMIMSELATVAILNGACFVFQILGCCLIAGAGGFLTMELVTTEPQFTSNESSWYIADPLFISVISGGVSLIVAIAFMIIFDQTADTLLYCFVYEKNRGGGGRYAPDSLAALLENTKE